MPPTDLPRPLEGRCALVTGSVQGLGLAAAVQLARAGCHVVMHGLGTPEAIQAARQHVEHQGARTLFSDADLRHPDQIERMMRDAADAFGGVDILVNNAVVRHAAPIEAFEPARWDEALAVNLSAAFHTTRLALASMKRQHWGRIINVSSIYGLRGTANRVAYVTTKTALIGLTRATAMETIGDGITCNALCPGTTQSPVHEAVVEGIMGGRTLTRAEAEEMFLKGKQPTGRFIPAKSVAAYMVFLCGPDADDITGAVLPMDGGWSSG